MKLFFSEYPPNYDQYQFPYQVWAIEENRAERDELLSKGFLPARFKLNLWYLARSSRVNLASFALTSENRRIYKKSKQFNYQVIPAKEFSLNSETEVLVNSYLAQQQFDISASAIRRIFSPHTSNAIFVWRDPEQTIVGLSPILVTDTATFYWYGFFKPNLSQTSLGMRMMMEAIIWSRELKLEYSYLGTVYNQSSLYKTNFSGFEFFNGIEWRKDKKELQYLIDRKSSSPELLKDGEYWEKFFGTKDFREVWKCLNNGLKKNVNRNS